METLVKWIDPNPGGVFDSPHCRVLYAYLHPIAKEILYIGKADYQTVSERARGRHKQELFERIAQKESISTVQVLVGLLHIPKGKKFSSALLSDMESLLIIHLQPKYNTQARRSRISRPGLIVNCAGDCWPVEKRRFVDD